MIFIGEFIMCLLATEGKTAVMESEPAASRQTEQTAGDPQATTAQNPKSSSGTGTSYTVIIKYDSSYVKSIDGILRLLHVVSCCYLSLC